MNEKKSEGMDRGMEREMDRGMDRRAFLKGALATAAASGAFALGGCAPAGSADASSDKEAAGASLVDHGVFKNIDMAEAEPIAPVDPPATWDGEADIVVVGTGGGGLAAMNYAVDNGSTVIAIEKNAEIGGATQHAAGWFLLPGGSKDQEALQYAYPSYPFDINAFMRAILPNYQFSIDDELLKNIALKAGGVMDWLQEHDGVEMTCRGQAFMDTKVISGEHSQILGMQPTCLAMGACATKKGADLRTNTTCTALVVENGKVVGVQATDKDGATVHYRGKRGVILCSGGFGMNLAMMEKYVPTALDVATFGGPMFYHTGECTRMALGLNADMSGHDSWCGWLAGFEEYQETGEFWHYFWDGATQLCRNVWLTIDKRGRRVPYYATDGKQDCPDFYGGMGDTGVVAAQVSRMGNRYYQVFDSNYPEDVFAHGLSASASPVTNTDNVPKGSLFSGDWLGDVEKAIDRGVIKKADTLDELADMLGLDPEVLKESVAHWNELCEQGEDTEMVYPYNPNWLTPVQKPPYYGARLGTSLGKTMCGVRVTPSMEVVDADGKVIEGLYANFSTAGGMVGESNYCTGLYNTTILGGNAMSWTTGYIAAEAALQ